MRSLYTKFSLLLLFLLLLNNNSSAIINGLPTKDKNRYKDVTTPTKPRSEVSGKTVRPKKDESLPNPKSKRKAITTSANANSIDKTETAFNTPLALSIKGIKALPTNFKKTSGPDPFIFSIISSKDSVTVGEEFELTVRVNFVDFGNTQFFLQEWYKYTLKVVMPKGFIQTGGDYTDYCTKPINIQNPQAVFTIKGKFEYTSDDTVFKVLRGFEGANDKSEFILKGERSILIYKSSKNINANLRVMIPTCTDPTNTSPIWQPTNELPSYPIGFEYKQKKYKDNNPCSPTYGEFKWFDYWQNTNTPQRCNNGNKEQEQALIARTFYGEDEGYIEYETTFTKWIIVESNAPSCSCTIPSKPTVTNQSFFVGDPSTPLSATASVGNTLKWYTNLTGGTVLTTAPTPSTSTIGTYYYYVSQINGTCESDREIITVIVRSNICNTSVPTNLSVSPGSIIEGTSTTITLGGACTTGILIWQKVGETSYANSTVINTTTLFNFGCSNQSNCISWSPVTLTVNATPNPCTNTSLSPSLSITNTECGTSTGQISVTGNGGVAPYQYKLGTGTYSNIATFTGLAVGSYTIFIKDNNGCEVSKSETVNAINGPIPPSSFAGGSRSGAGSVILLAECLSGGTVTWYKLENNGVSVGSGSPFTTENLSVTTDYYVSCKTNNCQSGTIKVTATILTIEPPTCTANPVSAPTTIGDSRQGAGSVTVKANCPSGNATWYPTQTSTTILWSGSDYSINNLSSTTTYYASCKTDKCESSRVDAIATILPQRDQCSGNAPSNPSVTSGSREGAGTVSLHATCGTNLTRWYGSSGGNDILKTANTGEDDLFITPSISNTTTYYAACLNNSGCESGRFGVSAIILPACTSRPIAPGITNGSRESSGYLEVYANCAVGGQTWAGIEGRLFDANNNLIATTNQGIFGVTVNTTTTFYAACVNTITGCESIRASVTAIVNPCNVASPGPTNGSNCGPGRVLLSASCGGDVTKEMLWYETATGGNLLYRGNDNDNSYRTPWLNSSKLYYVSCKNSNGCESPRIGVWSTIIPATISTASNIEVCQGSAINLQTTNTESFTFSFFNTALGKTSTYMWSGPNSFASTIQNPTIASAQPVNTGVYSAKVTNTYTHPVISGSKVCTAMATASVTVYQNPTNAPILTPPAICIGVTGTITATGCNNPNTVLWYNTANSTTAIGNGLSFPVVVPNGIASKTLFASCSSNTELGCNSVKSTVNVIPLVSPAAPTVAKVDKPQTCTDNNVTLSGSCTDPVNENILWYKENGELIYNLTFNHRYIGSYKYYSGCKNKITNCETQQQDRSFIVVTVIDKPLAPTNVQASANNICVASPLSFSGICETGKTLKTYNALGNLMSINTTTAGTFDYYIGCQDNITGCDTPIPLMVKMTVKINANTTVIGLTNNLSACAGTNLTLNASGANSYSWSGPKSFTSTQASPIISNTSSTNAGIYTVIGTSTASACTASATTTVTINLLTLTASSNSPVCFGSSIKLSSSGSTAVAKFAWKGPSYASSTQNPTITTSGSLSQGVYTVSGTSTITGCIASATTSVTVIALPVITSSSNSPVCLNSDIRLLVNSTGTLTKFAWKGPSSYTSSIQNPVINGASSLKVGVYSVTVTATNGCTNLATTNVSLNVVPTITASSNSTICVGNTLNLTSSGSSIISYSWKGPAPGNFTSVAQNPSITNTNSTSGGIYTVTGTANTGCTVSATTNVVVNSILPSVVPSSNSAVCLGSAINFSVTGANSYSWTGPNAFTATGVNPIISSANTTTAGVYTVIGFKDGCTATATTRVLVNSLPTISITSNSPVCIGSGSVINLNANGPNGSTYTWTGSNNFSSTLQKPVVTAPTSNSTITYTVVVKDINGCTATATTSVDVTGPGGAPLDPTATITTICAGESTVLSAGDCYGTTTKQWYVGTTPIANTTVSPTVTTDYYVACNNTCETPFDKRSKVTISVNPIPAKPTGINATINLCGVGTVNLAGNCPVNQTLFWNDQMSNNPVNFPNTGTYSYLGACQEDKIKPLNRVRLLHSSERLDKFNGSSIQGSNDNTNWVSLYTYSGDAQPTWNEVTFTNTTKFQYIRFWGATGSFGDLHEMEFYNGSTRLEGQLISSSDMGLPQFRAVEGMDGHVGTLWLNWTENNPYIGLNLNIQSKTNYCKTPDADRAKIVINVNAIPNVTASSSTPTLCSGGNISLSVSSNTQKTFLWTGPSGYTSTNQNPTIVSATLANQGVYTVTGFNTTGCTASATTSIAINANPTISVNANISVCAGSAINLTANGSLINQYSWNGPNNYTATSQNPTISLASNQNQGVYTVTGFNTTTGCSASAITSVSINSTPVIIPNLNNTVCEGRVINLSVRAYDSISDVEVSNSLTYLWNGPSSYTSTNQNPTIIAVTLANRGVYTVTAFNATGCTASATTSITVNANPTISVNANISVCAGNPINLTANGSLINQYSWTGPNSYTTTSQNPTISLASNQNQGIYTVTGLNTTTGCTASATTSITVNANPTISVNANISVCAGSSINLTANGSLINQYSWNGPNSYTTTSQNPTISLASSQNQGVYSVTGLNTATGCTASATTSITVNANPTISVNANISVCAGNPINLTANGSLINQYSWTGPNSYTTTSQNPTISLASNQNQGVYSVTGLNTATGCTASATTNIIVNANPTISVNANISVCAGSPINLTANGSLINQYSWTGPNSYTTTSQNPTISLASNQNQGVYSVTGLNTATGCTTSATTNITVNANPTVSVTPSIVCMGSNPTINSDANQFLWTGPNGFTSTNQNLTGLSIVGKYSLLVSQNGCTATSNFDLYALPTVSITPITICAGSKININSNANLFSWTGQSTFTSTSLSPIIQDAGNYVFTATNTASNCSVSTNITVKSSPNTPTPIYGKGYQCTGTNMQLIGICSPGQSAKWYSSATSTTTIAVYNLPITATSNTYYSGCRDFTTLCETPIDKRLIFNSPTLADMPSVSPIAEDKGSCDTGIITMTASGCQAGTNPIWYMGTPTSTVSNSNPFTTWPLSTETTFYVGCKDPNTLCLLPVDKRVMVKAKPYDIPVITTENNVAVCSGGTVNLTASGGLSYSWIGNGFSSTLQNPSIQNATAQHSGTYTVTVTNKSSCTATTTVAVVVTASTIELTVPSSICEGSNLSMVASGASTYAWSGPNNFTATEANPSINNVALSESGIYTVNGTFASGCIGSATTLVAVNTLPTISVTPTTVCVGGSVTINGNANLFSWSGASSFTSTSINQSFAGAGNYEVAASNSSTGCTSKISQKVIVNSVDTPTLKKQGSDNITTLNLYTSQSTYLETVGCADCSVQWYEKVNNTFDLITDENSSILFVKKLQAGTYIFKAKYKNNYCTSEFSNEVTLVVQNCPEVAIKEIAPQYVCSDGTTLLSVSDTQNGDGQNYEWFSQNLNADGTTEFITTNITGKTFYAQVGTYQLKSCLVSGGYFGESNTLEVSRIDIKAIVSPASLTFAAGSTLNFVGSDFYSATSGQTLSFLWTEPSISGAVLTNSTLTIPNITKANHEGEYTFTVTKQVGAKVCKSNATINTIINPVGCTIDFLATPSFTCDHNKGTINITATGTTVGKVVYYRINGGDWQTDNLFVDLPEGKYIVELQERATSLEYTDPNACFGISGSVTVDLYCDLLPETECSGLKVDENVTVREGESLKLSATGCPDGASLVWKDMITLTTYQNNTVITPTTNSKFMVTCTVGGTSSNVGGNGNSANINTTSPTTTTSCQSIMEVVVTPLWCENFYAGNDVTISKGESITLKAVNCSGTVEWRDDKYNPILGPLFSVSPAITTTYTANCMRQVPSSYCSGTVKITVLQQCESFTFTSDKSFIKGLDEKIKFTFDFRETNFSHEFLIDTDINNEIPKRIKKIDKVGTYELSLNDLNVKYWNRFYFIFYGDYFGSCNKKILIKFLPEECSKFTTEPEKIINSGDNVFLSTKGCMSLITWKDITHSVELNGANPSVNPTETTTYEASCHVGTAIDEVCKITKTIYIKCNNNDLSATLTEQPICSHKLIISGCTGGIKKWNLRGDKSLKDYSEVGVIIPYDNFIPTDLQVFCIKPNFTQSCAIIPEAIKCCNSLEDRFCPLFEDKTNNKFRYFVYEPFEERSSFTIFRGEAISIFQECPNGLIKWKDLSNGNILASGNNLMKPINFNSNLTVGKSSVDAPYISPNNSQDYQIECSYPSNPNAVPCSFTFHVEVLEICGKFKITAPKTKITLGSSLDLTADVVCPTASIQWSTGIASDNGKRTITVTPSTTTTYTSTCTTLKNSLGVLCPSTSFTVEVGVDCDKFILSSKDEIIQSGNSTTLTVGGCPSPAVLSWNTGQTTTIIAVSPTEFTKYTATCTLGTSVCTKDITIKVNTLGTNSDCYNFKVEASSTSVAQGSPINLTASGLTINPVTWNYNLGTGATKTVTPLDNTTYTASTFIFRDNVNRVCSSSVTVSVSGCNFTTNAKPATVVSGAKSTLAAIGCLGIVKWYNGSTEIATGQKTFDVNPTATTTYQAQCINGSNACINTVKVTVSPTNCTNFKITTANTSISKGEPVTFTHSGCTGKVTWSDNRITLKDGEKIIFYPNETSTYSATCESSGCVAMESILLKPKNDCSFTLTGKTTIKLGEDPLLTVEGCLPANLTWDWSPKIGTEKPTSPTVTTTYMANCKSASGNNTCQKNMVVNVESVACSGVFVAKVDKDIIVKGNNIVLSTTGCIGTVTWDKPVSSNIAFRPVETTEYTANCSNPVCTSKVKNYVTPTLKITQKIKSGSVELTVIGCETGLLSWDDDLGTNNIILVKPSETTTYTANCIFNYGAKDKVSVEVASPCKDFTLTASANEISKGLKVTFATSGCNGGKISWIKDSPSTYPQFTENGTSNEDKPEQTTTYKANCEQSGCSNETKVIVTPIKLECPDLKVFVSSSNINIQCISRSTTVSYTGCNGGTVKWFSKIGNITSLITPTNPLSFLQTPITTTTYLAECDYYGNKISDSKEVKVVTNESCIINQGGDKDPCIPKNLSIKTSFLDSDNKYIYKIFAGEPFKVSGRCSNGEAYIFDNKNNPISNLSPITINETGEYSFTTKCKIDGVICNINQNTDYITVEEFSCGFYNNDGSGYFFDWCDADKNIKDNCPNGGETSWYSDKKYQDKIWNKSVIPASVYRTLDVFYVQCNFKKYVCQSKITIEGRGKSCSNRATTPEDATASCAGITPSFQDLMKGYIKPYLDEVKKGVYYQQTENQGTSLANCIVNTLLANQKFMSIQGASFTPNIVSMATSYKATGIDGFLTELAKAFANKQITLTTYNQDIEPTYNDFKKVVSACFDPNPTSTDDLMAFENPYSCDVSLKAIDYKDKTVFVGYNGYPIDITTKPKSMPLKFYGSEMVGHEGQLHTFQVDGIVYSPFFTTDTQNFVFYGHATAVGRDDPNHPGVKIYSKSVIEKYTNPGGTNAIPVYLKTDNFGYYYFTDGNSNDEVKTSGASPVKVLSECYFKQKENCHDFNEYSASLIPAIYSQESKQRIFDMYKSKNPQRDKIYLPYSYRYLFTNINFDTNNDCLNETSNDFKAFFPVFISTRQTEIQRLKNIDCSTWNDSDLNLFTKEDFEKLDIACRIKLLVRLENGTFVLEEKEKLILELLKSGENDSKAFLEGLRDTKVDGKTYLEVYGIGLDNETVWKGNNNFTKAMEIITALCKKSYDWYNFSSIQDIQDNGLSVNNVSKHLKDVPLLFPFGWNEQNKDQDIYFDGDVFNTKYVGNTLDFTFTTQKYKFVTTLDCPIINGVPSESCVERTNKVDFENEISTNITLQDPFLPVGIYFNENTPSFLTENPGNGTLKIVPAYYLYYLQQKRNSFNVGRGIDVSLTALSLLVGAGEISLAYKGEQALRLAVATADFALDLSNLYLVTQDNSLSNDTRKALQIINIFGTVTTLSTRKIDNLLLKQKKYQNSAQNMIDAVNQIEKESDEIDVAIKIGGRTGLNPLKNTQVQEQLLRIKRHLKILGYSFESTLDALAIRFSKIELTLEKTTGVIRNASGRFVGSFKGEILTIEKGKLNLVENSSLVGKIEDFPEIKKVIDDGLELTTDGLRIDNAGHCSGNGTYCFTEDTPTETGELMTNKKAGDLISTINPTTGKRVMATLKNVKRGFTTQLTSLMIAGTLLNVTPAHALQNEAGDWIPASELHKGDRLRTPTGTVEVQDVCTEPVQATPVVSFELEDDLPYFVGRMPVLAASTCDLRTVYNALPNINDRVNFNQFIRKIKDAGGDYENYVGALAKNGFTENQIKSIQSGLNNFDNVSLKGFIDDFGNNNTFAIYITNNTSDINVWKIFTKYNKTNLRKTPDAIIAYKRIMQNTKAKSLGLTEGLAANVQGFNLSPYNVSYDQAIQKIEDLVTALPVNTTGFDKYIGTSGWGKDSQYDRRSVYVTADYLIASKNKISNATLEFEKSTSNGGFNSVTDVEIITSTQEIIAIETKAGDDFFTFVNSSGSNFSKQAHNMLIDANKLENIKVPLNSTVKADLNNPTKFAQQKQRVINAWKNWEGGIILSNSNVRQKFATYFNVPQITSSSQLENLLINNDNWFDIMFRNNNL
jgi:hypothetical protein